MPECDDCINKICKSNTTDEYIEVNGIFVKVKS